LLAGAGCNTESGLLKRADAKFKKHDLNGAITDLNDLIVRQPDSWKAYLARGDVRWLNGARPGR